MLSVQQIQRAVGVIWETEQERQRLRAGGDPIAVGYLVGADMTPNRLQANDARWPLAHLATDAQLIEKLRLVRHCPACRGQGTVMVQVDPTVGRIRLTCSACETELPVYTTDSEIMRFLPALIIGTVDKLAAVAYRSTLASLWCGPAWRCPEMGHGYGAGRWCLVEGCRTNPKGGGTPRRRHPVQLH